VLTQSVRPLCIMQGSEPDAWSGDYSSAGLWRMLIG
jgi:hypothetical protein